MHQELACWRATNGQRRRPKAWVGAGTGLRPAPLLRGLHIIFGPLKHQTVASKTVTTAGTRVATHNQGGYPRRPTDPFHEMPSATTRHLAQSVGSSDTELLTPARFSKISMPTTHQTHPIALVDPKCGSRRSADTRPWRRRVVQRTPWSEDKHKFEVGANLAMYPTFTNTPRKA